MAEQVGISEGQINRNFIHPKDESNVTKSMTVPESIKVSADSDMNRYEGDKSRLQGTAMRVPERIVLDGESHNERNSELARQNNAVNMSSHMGGMVTPPRTLTVDDTTSAYRGGRREAGKVESQKRSGDKNFEGKNAVGDRESLLQDYLRKDDNDVDDLNIRLQTDIVRLNQRVQWLEKRLDEKESNSFWKTTLVCLLTVMNPLLIHWLFTRRR